MNKKRRLSFGALLSTLFIVFVFVFSINAVYAYFSATANKEITINFSTLSLDVTNTNARGTFFTVSSNRILKTLPGDKLNFAEVNVTNTGDADAYILIKIEVVITKDGQEDLEYTEWYNGGAEKIDLENIATNTIDATLLKRSGETGDSILLRNLTWVLPGDDVTNNYQNASITASATAYAVQAYLPNIPESYNGDTALFATTFILNNYETFTN